MGELLESGVPHTSYVSLMSWDFTCKKIMSLGDVSGGEEKVSSLKWCVLTTARRLPIFDRR